MADHSSNHGWENASSRVLILAIHLALMKVDAALQLVMAAAHSDAAKQARLAVLIQTPAPIQGMFAAREVTLAPVDGTVALKELATRMVDSAAKQDFIAPQATYVYSSMESRNAALTITAPLTFLEL